jgi:hypothetical protein
MIKKEKSYVDEEYLRSSIAFLEMKCSFLPEITDVHMFVEGTYLFFYVELLQELLNMDHLHYSTLIGTLEYDMWIIDTGASRNMIRDQVILSNLNEKKTSYKVELGDKNTYSVEGIGQASIKLKTSNNVHLRNISYVPGLKRILYLYLA